MVFNKKEVAQSLKGKGFFVESGDHDYYRYHTLSDKRTHIRTKISHGSKPNYINKNLESFMAEQCKLSTRDFRKLIDCSINQIEYEELIENELVRYR